MSRMKMSDRFFGGVQTMRSTLAKAIAAQRQSLGLSNRELDAMCQLGPEASLPSSAELEEAPEKLSRAVVTRVLLPLGLNIDQVFRVDFSARKADLDEVMCEMRESQSGVVATAAWPGGESTGPRPESQAKVYVFLKALDEMYAAAASTNGRASQ